MGLLQNLAAVAIRNKVMANLRANCPEGIKTELETLLANKEAVGIIRKFVTEAMKTGGKIQAEAVITLPFPAEIRKLLADTPKLVTYLVLAARMAGRKSLPPRAGECAANQSLLMSEHPDIVVPEGAGFVPPEGVDFVVPDGEKLLWICRRPMPPATWGLVTLGVLLTLVAGCGIIYCLAEAELTGKLALIFGGLFLVIIAVELASLVHQRRVVRRTTYVLTDKKAYIQERLDKAAGKWLVFSFEVHPHMIHKVKRRRNGTVDYVLGKEHRGSLTLSTGFLYLPPELDPAAIFEQLSATMPVKGEKKRAVCEYKRPTPALLSVFGYSLLTFFFATGFILGYDNHGADLYVLGEETTAKVVTYEQGTEKRGRRNKREVTVYYPIVAFHTADGRTCVTISQTGYDKSPACEPGATVQILYHPDEPRYATIKDDSILIRPLVMLGGIIWALWSVWKEMRRWRRERRSAVIEVECSSKAE